MSDALTIRLEKSLLDRLEESAGKRGISKSELVRQSLVEYLEREGGRRAHTMLQLVGSVNGPSMAATNSNIRKVIRRKLK